MHLSKRSSRRRSVLRFGDLPSAVLSHAHSDVEPSSGFVAKAARGGSGVRSSELSGSSDEGVGHGGRTNGDRMTSGADDDVGSSDSGGSSSIGSNSSSAVDHAFYVARNAVRRAVAAGHPQTCSAVANHVNNVNPSIVPRMLPFRPETTYRRDGFALFNFSEHQ